jgi:hypothetical protein
VNTHEPNSSRSPTRSATAPARHADLTGDLHTAAESLHQQFDQQVGSAVVDVEIQRVADLFADARIRAYVPLFLRRFATHELRDRSGTLPRTQLDAAAAG